LGRVVLALISLTVTLIVAEVVLRATSPIEFMRPPEAVPAHAWRELLHTRSSIPGLSYELAPNRVTQHGGATITTNSFGMRDVEPVPPDAASTCNIIVLGDSYTFGFGVEANETYPKVLEQRLVAQAAGNEVQVLNFGVGGYNTRDEALVLEHKGRLWDPSLIIVGYVLNDPEIDPVQPLHRYYQVPKWWQHLNMFRLVAVNWRRREVKRLGGGDYIRYLHAEGGRKWAGVLEAFSDIRRIADESDTPVILAVFPLNKLHEWSSYPYRDLHSQVSDAGTRSGFHALDLVDPFSKYNAEEIRLERGDAHPSRLGHAIAADAIQKVISGGDLMRCN
jgi:hypothetical protein